jgi:hypothetical protein
MLTHGIATAPRVATNRNILENDELLTKFLTNVSQALLAGFRELPPFTDKERQFIEEKKRSPLFKI